MSYKILSIDGGGIRGVFSLEILKMLQEDIGKEFLRKFDCFTGTSTGALIVLSLMQGYQPKELIHFYSLFGRKIFPKRRKAVKEEAKYNNLFLETLLKTTISNEKTLADIHKNIIIPACYLSREKEKSWGVDVYDNFDKDKAKDWKLIDIALRTSAAPIYFPSYQNFVDGGIYALNPSLLAFSRAIDENGGNKEIAEIKILSIGAGLNPCQIRSDINWGVDHWMSFQNGIGEMPLVNMITDIGSAIPNYPLEQILKDRFLRINTTFDFPIEIDDASKVVDLRLAARKIKDHEPKVWDSYLDFISKL
jgi:patatin-like phospholipase/acyl hydrolase